MILGMEFGIFNQLILSMLKSFRLYDFRLYDYILVYKRFSQNFFYF